jgi:hypothetical protein
MPRSHSFSEASFLPLHCCIEYLRDREIVVCLNCPLHSCLVMSHHSLLPSTGSRLLQQRPFSRAQRPNKFHLRVRTQASKEGDNLVNEDLLAKLKAAEEEAQRLKKELATAKSQASLQWLFAADHGGWLRHPRPAGHCGPADAACG